MATVDELIVRLKADTRDLERQLQQAGVIVGNNAKKMEGGFAGVRNSLRGLRGEFGSFASALGPVVGAVGAQQIIRYADSWKSLENRLKLVTGSSEELAGVQDRLFNIAQETYTGLAPTVALYQRLTFATKGLGVAQDEVLTFTEQLNKQLLVGGLTATEASTTIFQLTQAFNKGKLDGDEFRTVLESAPPILEALEVTLKRTRGEILKMAAAGELGPRQLIDAVNGMADVTDERFKGMTFTVDQSLTRLDNAFTRFIGQSREVSSVSGTVSEAINEVAENMDFFGRAALAVAAVLSTRLVIGLGASLALMSPLSIALTAVVGGLVLLTTRTTEAQEEQQRHSKAMREAKSLHEELEKAIGKEREELEKNTQAYRENTEEKLKNLEAELKLIEGMNAKNREFTKGTGVPPAILDTSLLQERIRNLRSEIATVEGREVFGPEFKPRPSGGGSGGSKAERDAVEEHLRKLREANRLLNTPEPERTALSAELQLRNIAREKEIRLTREQIEEAKRLALANRAITDPDPIKEYIRRLEQEREVMRAGATDREGMRAYFELVNQLRRDGIEISEEEKQKVIEMTGANDQLRKSIEESEKRAKKMNEELRDGLTDTILHFDSATDAAKRFFEEIASQMLKRHVTGPIADALVGGGGGGGGGLLGGLLGSAGGIFGLGGGATSVGQAVSTPTLPWLSGAGAGTGISFFADGGRPPVGRPSIVGERGPEVFVPHTAGTIIPNGGVSGGTSVNVVNHWNISPGIQGTVRAELLNALPMIEARTQAGVFRAIERGGTEARIVGKRT